MISDKANTERLPAVAVVMSVYNGKRYLREQLDSILNQEGVDLRLVIRDDGSSDSSMQLILELLASSGLYDTEKIICIKGQNVGFAKSFSLALEAALQKWPELDRFAFADQDDVWASDKLIRGIIELGKVGNNEIPIAYASNTMLVDSDLNPMHLRWNSEKVDITRGRALVENFATGCTMIFNRTAAEIYCAGLPDNIQWHDFTLYQLCVYLGKFVWDPESRISYRQHANNQIGRQNLKDRMKMRLFSGNFRKRKLEKQARIFLEGYGELLAPEDKKMVGRLAYYRQSIGRMLGLLCSRKIIFSDFESSLFLKLKILLRGA